MRRRGNTARIILVLVLLVLGVSALIYFGYVFFQVEDVEVSGNGKYTRIYIEGLANIPEETHMLALDEDQIKQNIEENEPYLEVLSVKKKFPKTVLIEVKERQPKVLISYAEMYLLADNEAIVLENVDTPPENHYPIVEGFAITGVQLGKQINTEDTFKITVMGEIITALENRKLTEAIGVINLSDINSITMVSTGGLDIEFGQAEMIVDKVKWIDKMLPTLEKEGMTDGVLEVSMGTFATIRKGSGDTEQDADAGQQTDGDGTEPAGGGTDGDTGDGADGGDSGDTGGEGDDPDNGDGGE